MTLLRREQLCVLEASPPQSSPRGSCAARSSPEVSVPAPMCCDRHFLSTDGWRGSDGEGEVMQSQTLVPTKRCSSRGSSVTSEPADLQEHCLLRNMAPKESCGRPWSQVARTDGHLRQAQFQLLALLSQ